MAKRLIRDWTDSENVDALSFGAEVFFVRLIMKADDYGSFPANIKLLKANLFPLKDISFKSVSTWLKECADANLLFLYTVNGKDYLRIINFGQRMRNMSNKFPDPGGDSRQLAADGGDLRPEIEIEIEIEKEREKEIEQIGAQVADDVGVWPTFDDFWNAYDKKADRIKCVKKWNSIKQAAREKIMQHVAEYVQATPEIQYRKNPLTYLNNQSWNDEIIKPKNPHGPLRITKDGTRERLNSYRNK